MDVRKDVEDPPVPRAQSLFDLVEPDLRRGRTDRVGEDVLRGWG